MFFEIFLALLLGISFGIITGLIPGIHVNLIAALIVSFSVLLKIEPISLAVFIISVAITHSFLDSIPSIYLGAPDEAHALSILPGHKLLHQGEGHNAIAYTLIGSFFTLLLCLSFFPLLILLMKLISNLIQNYVGYLLILISTVMILKEKRRKAISLIFFLLSGLLGILVLNSNNLNQPLLPLLSGLFGVSILLQSLKKDSKMPEQDLNKKMDISSKEIFRTTTVASFVGFIAAFLPGLGNSQAAIIANELLPKAKPNIFLTLMGGINTANMLISIGTIYALDKARNGAIVAVNAILGGISFPIMLLLLITALIVASLSVLIGLKITKVFSGFIQKIDYRHIVVGIITLITCLSILFDSWVGLLILATATSLGYLAGELEVGKNHLMACLILPVILFFIL